MIVRGFAGFIRGGEETAAGTHLSHAVRSGRARRVLETLTVVVSEGGTPVRAYTVHQDL